MAAKSTKKKRNTKEEAKKGTGESGSAAGDYHFMCTGSQYFDADQ